MRQHGKTATEPMRAMKSPKKGSSIATNAVAAQYNLWQTLFVGPGWPDNLACTSDVISEWIAMHI